MNSRPMLVVRTNGGDYYLKAVDDRPTVDDDIKCYWTNDPNKAMKVNQAVPEDVIIAWLQAVREALVRTGRFQSDDINVVKRLRG